MRQHLALDRSNKSDPAWNRHQIRWRASMAHGGRDPVWDATQRASSPSNLPSAMIIAGRSQA